MKFFTLFFFLLLAGCGREDFYQEQRYVFGTLVEISIYGEKEEKAKSASSEVMREFERMHHDLHAWKPGKLMEINRAFAEGRRIKTDPEMAGIIRDAARISKDSGGLFNPAIGKLVSLWGFHSDEFKPVTPDPGEIRALLAQNPQMSDIVVEGDEIYSRNKSVRLDLGGYAKGYALDVAAKKLKEKGIENALVNIGGNIMALGTRGKRPWHVGIKDPREAGAVAELDLRDGEAIGTSGDYQRFFMSNGKRYCHIIDPRTGYPASGAESVTILIPKSDRAGTRSDAASKPIFISGIGNWRNAAKSVGVDQAMLIDDEGKILLTRAMAKRIEFLKKNQVTEVVP